MAPKIGRPIGVPARVEVFAETGARQEQTETASAPRLPPAVGIHAPQSGELQSQGRRTPHLGLPTPPRGGVRLSLAQ